MTAFLNFEEEDFVAMESTIQIDNMYYHKAMREPDSKEFQKAAKSELSSLTNTNCFSLRKRDKILKGTNVLPMVWQMRRKRNQRTGEIKV